ncbi:MAG: class I SAM-dependent methyltransferase [Bacillota bacterium]
MNEILFGLTGNTAKVKVLAEVAARLDNRNSSLRILDIGCTGPQPLAFWEPILESYNDLQFVGIDVQGIERAKEVAVKKGWKQVQLLEGSGYHLTSLFPRESFDIVVATQVLEHIARPVKFFQEAAAVLRTNGELFLTLDSAHWKSRFALRYPRRFMKNIVKKALASAGNERHYDLPWYDFEVSNFAKKAGLQVIDCRYYNLHPLKFVHNHVVPLEKKHEFMKLWFGLEELLNVFVGQDDKRFFMGLYFHVTRC